MNQADLTGSGSEIVVLTLVGVVIFSCLFGVLWWWQNRTPRTTAKAGKAAHVAAMPGQLLPELSQRQHPTIEPSPMNASPTIAPLPAPNKRKQTLLVAKSGMGKTQALISIAMADLRAGGAVYWLSPDATGYNEEDQPTDIRNIAIQIVDDYKDIAATIKAATVLIEQRRPAYKANQPKGQAVTLLIDEWPSIVAFDPSLADDLSTILFMGRKVGVWLVIASQSPYVDDLKLGSGVRSAFHTALARGVDKQGQRALDIDSSLDCKALGLGLWGCVVDGSTSIASVPMASIRSTDYAIPAPTMQLIGGGIEPDNSMLVALLQKHDLDDSNHASTVTQEPLASATQTVVVPDRRAISKLSPDQQLDYIIKALDRAGVSANAMKNHLQLQGNNNERLARISSAIKTGS